MSVMTGELAVAVPDADADTASERLAALFDAHHRRLYIVARRLSADAEDARDLVQEAFLRAARTLSSVPRGASAEEAWLVRVLINLARDRWRRAANRRRLDAAAHATAPAPVDPEAPFVARSVVWDALNSLSPRRRAVLVLHELEGQSVAEISRLLGVTSVTVRWHLSKGRREMVRRLRGRDA